MSEGNMREGLGSDASRLERRAGNLLRAYPPGYRADRGEEILGTLLEATPSGRSWPTARDTASVIRGGLRARRIAHQSPGAAASLRQAAILGITLYLTGVTSQLLSKCVMSVFALQRMDTLDWREFLSFLSLAAVLSAAWSGRRRLTAVAAVVAGTVYACTMHGSYFGSFGPELLISLLALAALILLTRSAQRLPSAWLWLPGLAMGVALLDALPAREWWRVAPGADALHWLGGWAVAWDYTSPHFLEIMAAVCACWLVTDVRPSIGFALGATTQTRAQLLLANGPTPLWAELAVTMAPLAVAFALALLLRRRMRSSPSAVW